MDPLFLSPALPSTLIHYIIHHCTYPTTLIICSDRAEFLSTLTQDVKAQQQQQQQQYGTTTDPDTDTGPGHIGQAPRQPSSLPDHTASAPGLLAPPPLYQLAVTRHIRTVFIPTVSHLRAFLSVFTVQDNLIVSAPPATTSTAAPGSSSSGANHRAHLLLVYGFLGLHRHTSEWSVQGVSGTAAVLVEAAKKAGLRAVIVEAPAPSPPAETTDYRQHEAEILSEKMPVLSGSSKRTGLDLEGTGWTAKTIEVSRVLGRWFRFQKGEWEA
ncbi:hypothetical protein QBC40DRAFT_230469 [Triangularia verruculosa]|uniref:Uncharacterized protein n=1 Tax=Triangularia verruculosa TaxID=2587418 RepID=A0AAN7AT88_9PEZI|nr:hypothetical protein QBC40DRAFT_230469 [Triangularia verruculosa]